MPRLVSKSLSSRATHYMLLVVVVVAAAAAVVVVAVVGGVTSYVCFPCWTRYITFTVWL